MRIHLSFFNRCLLPLITYALFALPTYVSAQLRNHDAFVGYSRTGSETFYPNVGGLNGWEVALHIHLHPFLGVEGDVAHYGLGASASVPQTTVMVGPRVSVKALGVNLFAHGLVGGEHSANSAGARVSGGTLAYAIGGGVDLPVLPFFAWRFGADRISAPTISPDSSNKFRVNTGLVFRF
jgi:hypothetical protein